MKNRISSLILAVFCSFMLIASGQAQAKDSYKIGAAVYGLKGEFMRLWKTALERHPAVKSGLVKVTVFDGKYDASVQQSQFETMVTQGFDAIIFVPIDIEAGAAAVELAASENIPVIGSNTRVNSDKLTSYIGSNDVESGGMEAEAVLKKIGYKGNVVIIEGPIGQSAQIERRKGNLMVLKKNPDVKLLEMKTANWSRAEAMSLMENWLSAHPEQIQGIIGQNDEMALGAIQALKAAGENPKSFAIAGIDGVTDAMMAVKDGTMVSILQDATGQAQGALDLALRAVIGESYKPTAKCWTQYKDGMPWGDNLQKVYNVPWTPITNDNVDSLLKEREELTKR